MLPKWILANGCRMASTPARCIQQSADTSCWKMRRAASSVNPSPCTANAGLSQVRPGQGGTRPRCPCAAVLWRQSLLFPPLTHQPTGSVTTKDANWAAEAHRAVDVSRQVLRQVAPVSVVHDHAQVIAGQVRLPHANDVRMPLQPCMVHQLPACGAAGGAQCDVRHHTRSATYGIVSAGGCCAVASTQLRRSRHASLEPAAAAAPSCCQVSRALEEPGVECMRATLHLPGDATDAHSAAWHQLDSHDVACRVLHSTHHAALATPTSSNDRFSG